MALDIVVVTGLPRSGTSLVMQMLAAGGLPVLTDGLRPPDEDNPKGYLEWERVKGLPMDTDWLAEAEGRAVKVIHALVPRLPLDRSYRAILVERDVREVVRSQERMLARSGKPGGGLGPERMQAIMQLELDRLKSYLDSQSAFATVVIRHADLISNPLGTAGVLAGFTRDGLDAERMASMVSPDLYRNRA